MKLSKAGTLSQIEDIGKSIAFLSTPHNYPAEKIHRAAHYAALLPLVRQAYAAIANDQDIVKTLKWLQTKIVTGIERNKLDLTIKAAQGDLNSDYWQVVDGFLQSAK